jgi:hypothetical protein
MSARNVVLALALAALAATGCRKDRQTPKQLQAEIAALEKERDALRARVMALMEKDPRVEGMPKTPVRVSVPTVLMRELIEKVTAGFVDQVTLELKNLKAKKSGTVKKVVSIGQYDLQVSIDKVSGRLKTGKPDVRFGGNKVTLALPVTVASGSGHATIHFKWDGKNVSGAVCGDMEVTQEVSGKVKPASYPMSGTLVLEATAQFIMARPQFPELKVRLKVDPSAESWAAVDKILAEKTGVCGYVVEKVDVRGILERIVEKGFNVKLPVHKIKPLAVPVGIEPTMTVRGQPVALAIKVGGLTITEHSFWLGAHVSIDAEGLARRALADEPAAPAKPAEPAKP